MTAQIGHNEGLPLDPPLAEGISEDASKIQKRKRGRPPAFVVDGLNVYELLGGRRSDIDGLFTGIALNALDADDDSCKLPEPFASLEGGARFCHRLAGLPTLTGTRTYCRHRGINEIDPMYGRAVRRKRPSSR